MEQLNYPELISRFKDQRILVIGDLILDAYIKGESHRLCPEAPVPVVDVHNQQFHCGGAANAALNLHRLGATVSFCSVTGKDEYGAIAGRLLKAAGIDTSCLIEDEQRQTLVKTRVLSGRQLLVRYDLGTTTGISAETEKQLISKIKACALNCPTLLIADYDKGLLSPGIIQLLEQLKTESPKFIAIDSKRLPVFRRLNPSLIKPNYQEAITIMNQSWTADRQVDQVREFGETLSGLTGARMIAITLDSQGVMLWEKDQSSVHVPAKPVFLPQVSGAGDTFIAACCIALVSGASLGTAGKIACAAAAIAISKEGTAACNHEELLHSYLEEAKFINELHQLTQLCQNYRSQGKKIVFTNGCFDILHSGHVRYLAGARALGDVLIVGVNTDESISRLKGPSRPVNSLYDRVQVLSALEAVSYIIPFGSEGADTPALLIEQIRPDFFVKGGDYTRERLNEAALVEKYGGQIRIMPYLEDHSTSLLISRISGNYA